MSTTQPILKPQQSKPVLVDIIQDQEFRSLSPQVRSEVLSQLDERFAGLEEGQKLSLASDLDGFLASITPESSIPKKKSFFEKAGRFIEDVGYPAMGAAGYAAAGAPLGPLGMLGMGAFGAGAGQSALELKRQATEGVPLGNEGEQQRIALSMMGGVVQEAPALLRQTKNILNPKQQAALSTGVPLTKGQAKGSLLESQLRSIFSSKGEFRKLAIDKQIPALEVAMDDLVSKISTSSLAGPQKGEFIQKAVSEARELAGEGIGTAMDNIVHTLPRLSVPQKGSLAKSAKDLLFEITKPTAQHPSLRSLGSEDLNKAVKVLREFTDTSVTIPIKDAAKLRSLIFKLSDSDGVSSIGQASLKRLNAALTDAISESVRGAGRQDLLDAWMAANKNFRGVASKMDETTIKAIMKSDKPEVIIDYLLQPGVESKLTSLEGVIGSRKMEVVRRAALERMFEKSSKEGILLSQSFANMRDKLGERAIEKIVGANNVSKFDELTKVIDALGLTTELIRPASSGAGLGLVAGGLGGAAVGLGTGNTGAAASSLLFSAGVTLIPKALAMIITRKGGLVTVENIIQQGLKQGGRQEAIRRLIGLAASETGKAGMAELLSEPDSQAEKRRLIKPRMGPN